MPDDPAGEASRAAPVLPLCYPIADPGGGVIMVERQHRQHRPGHIADIAADLIAILQPAILRLVPPAGQFHRLMIRRARRIGVAQAPIMPEAVVIESEEDRLTDPLGARTVAAADQSDGGGGVVIEKSGIGQRPRLRRGIAGEKDGAGGRGIDQMRQLSAGARWGCLNHEGRHAEENGEDPPVTKWAAHSNFLALSKLIRLNKPREYVVKTAAGKKISLAKF